MAKTIHFLLALSLIGLTGCSSDDNGNGGETDPCAEVTCKAHSFCEEGECFCNAGFHEEGGSCLPDEPCRFIHCEENQHCEAGACLCDEGYHMLGGVCAPDDACIDITCPPDEQCVDGVCVPDTGECCGYGTLDETGAEPTCVCDAGYNDVDGDLLCGPDDPADWPPSVDDLYNGADMLGQAQCLLPACHDCGYPGDMDTSGLWTRHTHTISSTCDNALVNGYDARTVLGNESDEADLELGLFIGTCRWDTMVSPRREAGAMIQNHLAGCVINERLMGIHSVEYEIVSYDPDTDTLSGPAKAWVIGSDVMPEFGVPCHFEMEISYARQ